MYVKLVMVHFQPTLIGLVDYPDEDSEEDEEDEETPSAKRPRLST